MNLDWMAATSIANNEEVMQTLQEMWDSGETGLIVLYREVENGVRPGD